MASRAGVAAALGAAALFGLTTPLAKRGLEGVPPLAASSLLYFAAGLTLGLFWLLSRSGRGRRHAESPLRRADLPYLAGSVVAGGVVAPALLLYGLGQASGSTASLLLNLELVFTVSIAFLLGENVGLRSALGMGAILAGCALLGLDPAHAGTASWAGIAAIAGACLGWAVDNNLVTRISGKDPVAIAGAKSLVAGPISLLLALGLALASRVPDPGALAAVMLRAAPAAFVLGALGYGLSLVLFVHALRNLGAARTGSLFATAPFAGAAAAVALGDPLSWPLMAAGGAMALGVALVSVDAHDHEHVHDPVEHEHLHSHDEHHRHDHEGSEGAEPHSHSHRHDRLVHSHPHVPDLHHRHRHDPGRE